MLDTEMPPVREVVLLNGIRTCPFCGGYAELRAENDGRDETYAIHCTACNMHFTKFVWRAYDKEDVLKDWNRRDSDAIGGKG